MVLNRGAAVKVKKFRIAQKLQLIFSHSIKKNKFQTKGEESEQQLWLCNVCGFIAVQVKMLKTKILTSVTE